MYGLARPTAPKVWGVTLPWPSSSTSTTAASYDLATPAPVPRGLPRHQHPPSAVVEVHPTWPVSFWRLWSAQVGISTIPVSLPIVYPLFDCFAEIRRCPEAPSHPWCRPRPCVSRPRERTFDAASSPTHPPTCTFYLPPHRTAGALVHRFPHAPLLVRSMCVVVVGGTCAGPSPSSVLAPLYTTTTGWSLRSQSEHLLRTGHFPCRSRRSSRHQSSPLALPGPLSVDGQQVGRRRPITARAAKDRRRPFANVDSAPCAATCGRRCSTSLTSTAGHISSFQCRHIRPLSASYGVAPAYAVLGLVAERAGPAGLYRDRQRTFSVPPAFTPVSTIDLPHSRCFIRVPTVLLSSSGCTCGIRAVSGAVFLVQERPNRPSPATTNDAAARPTGPQLHPYPCRTPCLARAALQHVAHCSLGIARRRPLRHPPSLPAFPIPLPLSLGLRRLPRRRAKRIRVVRRGCSRCQPYSTSRRYSPLSLIGFARRRCTVPSSDELVPRGLAEPAPEDVSVLRLLLHLRVLVVVGSRRSGQGGGRSRRRDIHTSTIAASRPSSGTRRRYTARWYRVATPGPRLYVVLRTWESVQTSRWTCVVLETAYAVRLRASPRAVRRIPSAEGWSHELACRAGRRGRVVCGSRSGHVHDYLLESFLVALYLVYPGQSTLPSRQQLTHYPVSPSQPRL